MQRIGIKKVPGKKGRFIGRGSLLKKKRCCAKGQQRKVHPSTRQKKNIVLA